MSYKTYTTEAIICGSTERNTSDKHYLLFTYDAGMVYASARSVREEKSKQRYALQDFSFARVSLVKGKNGWRVGSAQALGNSFLRAQSRVQRAYINFIVMQLRRYVHGEVPLQKVYRDVASALTHPITDAQGALLQQLFSLRLLYELGYIADDDLWKPVIEADTVIDALALYTTKMQTAIAHAVRAATQASHL